MTDHDLRDLLDDAADDRGRMSLAGHALVARARGARRRRRALAAAAGTAAAAAAVAALVVVPRVSQAPEAARGTDSPSPTSPTGSTAAPAGTGEADRAALLDSVRNGGGASSFPHETLRELLEAVAAPPEAAYVKVGRVLQAVPGSGYVQSGPDADDVFRATPVDFDDPDADFWTLEVTIAVDETLVGPNGPATYFEWPLITRFQDGVDTSLAVRRGLEDLGRVLVVLEPQPGLATDGGSRTPCERFFCVAQVGAGGRIGLPFLGDAAAAEFLDGLDTVEEAREVVR